MTHTNTTKQATDYGANPGETILAQLRADRERIAREKAALLAVFGSALTTKSPEGANLRAGAGATDGGTSA